MKDMLMQLNSQWQEVIAPFRKRWMQLVPREQYSLLVLAGFVVVLFLVFVVWMPSHKAAEKARTQYENNRQLLLWMHVTASQARATPTVSGGSVLGDVNSMAGSAGLNLSRVEPEGDRSVRVWVEKADFNVIAAWLNQMSARGISAGEIQVERLAAGGVSGRFTLSR